MAGRFPFDSSGHSGSNPLNNPQVRAALGLGNIDEAVYLQQMQQQERQRDFHLRQMLLQEQLEQQNRLENILAQEQQLKAIGDHLQEFPDLQQHYSRILLNEQLQRTEERTLANDRLRLQAEEELRRRQFIAQQQQQQLQQQQQQEQHLQQQQQQEQHQQQQQLQQKQQQEQQQQLQQQQQQEQQLQQQQQQQQQEQQLQQQQQQQQQQEQLQQQQQQLHHQQKQQQNIKYELPPAVQAAVTVAPKIQCVNQSMLRDIAADSLAGNAIKRSDIDKRQFVEQETDNVEASVPTTKKRARSNSKESLDIESSDTQEQSVAKKMKKEGVTIIIDDGPESDREKPKEHKKATVQDILDFALSTDQAMDTDDLPPSETSPSVTASPRGSFGDLIEAARSETQNDDAADILTSIKRDKTEWSDSEDEADEEEERQIAVAKGDTIMLPNFKSYLPQLPEEPMLPPPETKKKKRKKHKGILDEDDSSVETKSSSKKKDSKASKAAKDGEKKAFERVFGDLLYPIDPWWPTTTSIKRERKFLGQSNHDDDDNCQKLGNDNQFNANLEKIEDKLKNNVEPGVLEKIPHCRVHRMAMKKRKNTSAPELVYCTQVTELYPNDIMVCCSRCGTWRHTGCGGHYKEYSVREAIDKPFEVICDRCHVEEKILEEHPGARIRIEKQRCEQLRRGLSTSAAMRQHSFSKHGGTYKWPLGSVSATHIGGHTRSVHSRHDKAEKQWTDMATKLCRGYGHRPKEKVKVRTKEFERLLISIEDAEGHTDRHNMLVFLMQDTLKNAPVGFEKTRRNIFDPEDDDDSEINQGSDSEEGATPDNEKKNCKIGNDGEKDSKVEQIPCKRDGCTKLCRFDSTFCSDACGVSTLEKDLLRTFFYSSDIHPSSLRH